MEGDERHFAKHASDAKIDNLQLVKRCRPVKVASSRVEAFKRGQEWGKINEAVGHRTMAGRAELLAFKHLFYGEQQRIDAGQFQVDCGWGKSGAVVVQRYFWKNGDS